MRGAHLGVLHSAKGVNRNGSFGNQRLGLLPSERLRSGVAGGEMDWRKRGKVGTDGSGMPQLVGVMAGNAEPAMPGQRAIAKGPRDASGQMDAIKPQQFGHLPIRAQQQGRASMPASIANLTRKRCHLLPRPPRQPQLHHADASSQRPIDGGKKSCLVFSVGRRRNQVVIRQAQDADDGPICRWQQCRIDILQGNPGQFLPLLRADGSGKINNPIGLKHDALVRDRDQSPTDPGVDTEFLVEFADKGRSGVLTGFDLAAGKLPKAGMRLAWRALRQKDAAALITDDAGNNVQERVQWRSGVFTTARQRTRGNAVHGNRLGSAQTAMALLVLLARSARTRIVATDLWRVAQDGRR